MWWLIRSKERQDERLRIQMELALAQPCPLIDKAREDLYRSSQEREHERQLREMKLAMMPPPSVIEYLYNSDQISLEEYTNYMLDETGLYLPKLKTKS